MATVAETPRLLLDRFVPADVGALRAYRNDPDVARYQSWDAMSVEEAAELVAEQAGCKPGSPGWSQLAVRLKSDGRLIGDIGLFVDAEDRRLGEMGFTFARSCQGKGFATEAVKAALRLAFDDLHMHRIKAIVDCRNTPACRLLERVGFRREGHFLEHAWFKGAWCDEYLYALLRADWERRSAPGSCKVA